MKLQNRKMANRATVLPVVGRVEFDEEGVIEVETQEEYDELLTKDIGLHAVGESDAPDKRTQMQDQIQEAIDGFLKKNTASLRNVATRAEISEEVWGEMELNELRLMLIRRIKSDYENEALEVKAQEELTARTTTPEEKKALDDGDVGGGKSDVVIDNITPEGKEDLLNDPSEISLENDQEGGVADEAPEGYEFYTITQEDIDNDSKFSDGYVVGEQVAISKGDRFVTQEDLDNNPELAKNVVVGDLITIGSLENDQGTERETSFQPGIQKKEEEEAVEN